MSRNVTEAFAAAMTAPVVSPILLFEAEFSTSTVYMWTGIGDLAWNSQTYTGIGNLVGVSAIEESDDLKANGINVTLAGVSPAHLELVLNELRLGKPGSIRLGLFDQGYDLGDESVPYVIGESAINMHLGIEGGGLIPDPKIIFKGRLDVGGIDDSDPTKPIVTLNYENELIDLERPREWRFTDEHQKKLYSGDRGDEYIAGLQDAEIIWGRR